MNYKKLCFHNLGKPLDQRINAAAIECKLKTARYRGAVMGLWATIHAEVQAVIAAKLAQPNYQE
jgi:hypothetical protein